MAIGYAVVLMYRYIYNQSPSLGCSGHFYFLYTNNNPANIFIHTTLCTFANVAVGWVSKVECHRFRKIKRKIQALLIVELTKQL